jgi:MraZ protein
MNCFFETYECKIDDKGRIKLPLPLIKHIFQFSENEMIVKRSVFQKCLEVYPMKPWEKLMEKINGLNRFVKKNADFIRMFTAGVKTVEVDKADRILIPKDLKTFANLSKEIVISGAGEFFEVWNKADYEENIVANEADFAKFSEEVMGGINFNNEI